MHRVSSRQRLVSWDAFDAAATTDDSDTDPLSPSESGGSIQDAHDISDLKLSASEESGRKRKKKSLVKPAVSPDQVWDAPHVIEALPFEVLDTAPTTTVTHHSVNKPIALLSAMLSQDAQLHIVSFLNEEDARNMMQVNHYYRHLLQNSSHVWKGLARQRWPFLSESCNWSDRLHLPLTVRDSSVEEETNMSLLLHLAAETKSSCIDESIFQPCANSRDVVQRRQQRNQGTLRRSMLTNELRTVMLRDERSTAVQFTGRIGFGDRCIRADQPLPRPHHLTKNQMRSLRKLGKSRNFWQRLLRRHDDESPQWRPFVAPFSLPDGTVSFTPRLISYFEVHIVNTNEMSDKTPAVDHPHGLQLDRVRASSSECVAVGLSLTSFHLHSRMPGWDALSYGWHGDDGGLFHNNGQMVRHFGSTFGVGDVVGCGIDYQTSSLFYTLNGEFLGYAFEMTEAELLMDWYPTVGVDTNSLVQCNFGTDRPFQFDLQSMIEKDRETLVQTVGPHEL